MEFNEHTVFKAHDDLWIKVYNIKLKKKQLLELLLKYIRSDKTDVVVDERELEMFDRASIVNWKIQKVGGYQEVEKSNLANISLKPLSNIPREMPEWFNKYGFSGIWWILHGAGSFTYGQVCDISQSLRILSKFFTREKWVSDLSGFFDAVCKNRKKLYVSILT
ncbi:MAG: hypothetical protein ACTSUE_13950 [Promethearchaeota archaeon]